MHRTDFIILALVLGVLLVSLFGLVRLYVVRAFRTVGWAI
jgi:hypothetical protein